MTDTQLLYDAFARLATYHPDWHNQGATMYDAHELVCIPSAIAELESCRTKLHKVRIERNAYKDVVHQLIFVADHAPPIELIEKLGEVIERAKVAQRDHP